MKTLFTLLFTLSMMVATSQTMFVRITLWAEHIPNEWTLWDGVAFNYTGGYCNCVDSNDAWKIGGDYNTSISIIRPTAYLVVEARDSVHLTDTTHFRLRNYRVPSNMLAFTVFNPQPANIVIKLYDSYTNTYFNVSTAGDSSKYFFTQTVTPWIDQSDRFSMIVINVNNYVPPPPPAPVERIYTEFKAYPNPVHGMLRVEFPDSLTHQLYISSTLGVRYKLNNVVKEGYLNMSAFSAGVYILYDQYGSRKTLLIK